MMRSSKLLLGFELGCVPHLQRRFKSFVPKVDRTNQYYFQLSPRGSRSVRDGETKTQAAHDFFEMPDLLLDLDAENNPNVRVAQDADETWMRGKWHANPRRWTVRASLKSLEQELFEARRISERAGHLHRSTWIPSQHDILSAALLGSPRMMGDTLEVHNPELRHHWESLGSLAKMNGIPTHAAKKDILFLEWLMLRHRALGQISPRPGTEVHEAIHASASIRGIRRVIFQNLAAEQLTDLPAYTTKLGFSTESTPNIPQKVRQACLGIISSSEDQPAAYVEILSFLGNLLERLSASEARLGGTLHAFALRISAEAGLPAVSSMWITRGYENNIWMNGKEVADDVLETLNAYIKSLENLQETGSNRIHERQFLFQVISGLKDHNLLAPESLRTLSTFLLSDKSTTPAKEAYAIYESYIRLMGKLGAIRTLWNEAQSTATWVRKKLQRSKTTGDVDALFREALVDALRVAVVPDEEGAHPDPSLEECVTLDYHSIGGQNPNAYLQPRDSSGGKVKALDEDALPSYGLPFDEWLPKIRETLRHTRMASSNE